MSNPEIIGRLLFRHVRKELTVKEKAELSDWRKLSQKNEELFQTETNPERIRKVIGHISESRDIAFQKFQEKYPQYREIQIVKPRARIFRIARIAAILVVVISVSLYFILNERSVGSPGTYKAELISSDNIIQALNDGVRGFTAARAGIRIDKKDNGELLYIVPDRPHAAKDKYYGVRTPRGGQFSVQFPDGTLAWLNAQSSIKYPANFSQDSIHIIVDGEVYFEVAPATKHFFTVSQLVSAFGKPPSNNSLQIKTSGAHFDAKSYADEQPFITVIEGVAQVGLTQDTGKEKADSTLHHGEEAIFFGQVLLVGQTLHPENIIAWKNGMTTYHKSCIWPIMRDISRWYNVDVEYMGEIPNKTFNLNVSREANLKEILTALSAQGIHLYLHARKITVSP